MMYKLQGLKGYKTAVYPMQTIVDVFPHLIADYCKSFLVTRFDGHTDTIGYDWGRLLEFQINLGSMISSHKFEYLDNVVLQLFKSYSYIYTVYQFYIDFDSISVKRFVKTCDTFKNKEWDDVIDDFVDALHDLFSSGTFLNKKVMRL